MKFVIDHDYHLHSRLSSCSNDSAQTAEAMLEYAKANNLKRLCITDHFWDSPLVPGASQWYLPQNFPHVSEALPLPVDDDVDFYFGCETDFDKNFTLGISPEHYDAFDFIIVPTSHLHMKGFTIPEEVVSPVDRARYYMQRNNALLDLDLPFHKVGLAHFTCSLISHGGEGTPADLINAISDADLHEFFERVAKCGMGVELNMQAKDLEYPELLRPYKIARECGCKFYLGSDAHTNKELLSAIPRFEAVVEALSLTEDDKFHFHK